MTPPRVVIPAKTAPVKTANESASGKALGETVPGYGLPDTWFGVLGPANMPKPVVDKLNADRVIDEYSEMLGVDPELLHSADEVAEVRAQRAQQAQAKTRTRLART
jgi:hypothetical protein